MIKNVLLGVFATAWLFVMVITAWRKGDIPPELWLYLGIGTGGLLAIFQRDEAKRTEKSPPPEKEPPT